MNAVSIWWLLIVVNKVINQANANWITGNLCWSMPCLNGGSCFGSAYTYLCICPIHYTGALCEKRLGVCEENPCGNRGVCIETSLTSFECRCYYDYMGPRCEEVVPKKNTSIWSSLLPSHTRVLFNMLKDAYLTKAKQKSKISFNTNEVDFIGLLSTSDSTSSPIKSLTSTTQYIDHTNQQNQITATENVIRAEAIQLENIFPSSSTPSNDYQTAKEHTSSHNPTTSIPDYDVDIMSIPIILEDMITTEIGQIQTTTSHLLNEEDFFNITESVAVITDSTSIPLLNDTVIMNDLTTESSFEQTNNITAPIVTTTAQSNEYIRNVGKAIDDYDSYYLSDPVVTSYIDVDAVPLSKSSTSLSQNEDNQLLIKLCRQILLNISPNTSSAAVLNALNASLVSHSSSLNNVTTEKLIIWLNKYLSTSTSSHTPSTVPTILVKELKPAATPLKRIEIDDALHEINNNDAISDN